MVRRKLLAAYVIVLGFLCGCTTTPGGGVTLFPTGHFLLERTEELAATAPQPAMLPRELQKAVLTDYYIEPGDVLLVEPESFDSPLRFPSDQTVLADGTIDLGRYGRLVVAGQTVEQIEAEVRRVIEVVEEEEALINVRLISPQGAVYYVLGEVNSPGSFPLIGRETTLDGILAAGGLTDRASPCNIILSRPTPPNGCRVVLPICYRQITQLGDTATNYQLMPGDRIYVATRTFCEELAWWRTRRSCSLCQGLQCPCPDPSVAMYGPSFPSPVGPLSPALPAAPIYPPPPTADPLPQP